MYVYAKCMQYRLCSSFRGSKILPHSKASSQCTVYSIIWPRICEWICSPGQWGINYFLLNSNSLSFTIKHLINLSFLLLSSHPPSIRFPGPMITNNSLFVFVSKIKFKSQEQGVSQLPSELPVLLVAYGTAHCTLHIVHWKVNIAHFTHTVQIGLIRIKEEGWTGFSEGWQGCSEGNPEIRD